MKDVEIIGMLKSYVQKSLVGVGALKGAPCKIQSITDGDGFHTVKFEWTDDAGTSHTSDMIVNDGSDIASITQDGATITVKLSDDTSHDFIVPTVQGPKGDKGDKGDTGAGVPEGGTAGQVLVKKSSTDYDTEWGTPAGGGDMLKSVYDTDNDGKVDSAENADTVDGHTVAKDVPADAVFTDTVYDDTEIRGEIDDKVDKIDGKGLSTNDYTNADKAIVDGVTSALSNKVDKVTGKGLSTNDYSDADKAIVDGVTSALAAKADKSTVDGILDGTNIDSFADVETALADYQTKNLTTPITVDGVQKTTVEDTLSALNEFGEDERDMRYLYNCKNLLSAMTSPHTSRDVVFTPNDKGEITCSGSVSISPSYIHAIPIDQSALVVGKKYILSGLPDDSTNCYIKIYESGGYVEISGGTKTRMITYDGTNIKSWDCGVRTVGTDATGKVFKPMLCLKSDYDNDPTYVPPANTNQYLSAKKADWSAVNALYNDVSGTKNILESVGANSTTIRSVLFTKNSDGSVTASGTQDGTGGGSYYHVNDYIYGDGKKYILTGCPEGGSRTTYRIYLYDNTTGSTGEVATDSGSGSSVTLISGHTYICNIHIGPSQTVSDLTFHPMLRLASIQDDTYVPYAKTNQQLTAENEALTNNINVNGSKNVLASLTPSGTYLGITISRNESGDIVVNGTATASPTTISLFDRTFKHLGEATILKFTDLGIDKTKKYVFSRAEKVSNFRYNIRVMNGTTQVAEIKLGNDDGLYTVIDFSQYTCDGLKAGIVVANGTTITNKVFSAMLCLESDYDLDPTYQPYAKTNRELTKKIDIVGNLFTTTTKVVDNITHGIATTVATLENLPIGTYVVSGQFNSDSAMSGGGLVQFASSGVIQNGASCSTMINQGFKANAGLTGIFNVTNATNQINLQIYTANADLTVSSARLAAIRIA